MGKQRKDGTPAKSAVRWTAREEEEVAREGQTILENPDRPANRAGNNHVVKTVSAAYNIAQRVLPPDRRKTDSAFYYKPEELRERHRLIILKLEREKKLAADAAIPVASAALTPPSQAAQLAHSIPASPNPFEALRALAVDFLASVFVDAFKRAAGAEETPAKKRNGEADEPARAHMPADVRKDILDFINAQRPGAAAERSRRRVDIVGLKGNQREVVDRHAVAMVFDLRYLPSDQHVKRADLRPEVVLCTKFMQHSDQTRYRQIGARLYYANGGAESVIKCLMHASKDQPPAPRAVHH